MRSLRQFGLLAGGIIMLGLAVPNLALAQTSVEGSLIGDQNFYWMVPGQVWIFPHTLGNVDNRVALQVGQTPSSPSGAGAASLVNAVPAQVAPGGGFIIEPMQNFNIGLWI